MGEVPATGDGAPASPGMVEKLRTEVETAAVTGMLNLGSHAESPDMEMGLLKKNQLPQLTAVPASVFALTKITSLTLKYNRLTTIAGLEVLVNLESLDLSENSLTELAGATLGALVNLRELVVSENQLTTLPAEIGQLAQLETMSLFKNKLKALPDEIGHLAALVDANFFNNVLIKLPATLAKCAKLEILNVGGNKLKTLPSTDLWTELRELKAHQNGLFMMPSFRNLAKLEILKLDFNKALETLPDFGDHPALEHFEVGNCNVTGLPAIMVNWPLKNVYLSANKIKVLPPLAQPTLEILNFSGNDVEVLPASLAKCTSLKTLFLDKNRVTAVPDELANLADANLTRINLSAQKVPGLKMTPGLDKLKKVCEAKKGRFIF